MSKELEKQRIHDSVWCFIFLLFATLFSIMTICIFEQNNPAHFKKYVFLGHGSSFLAHTQKKTTQDQQKKAKPVLFRTCIASGTGIVNLPDLDFNPCIFMSQSCNTDLKKQRSQAVEPVLYCFPTEKDSGSLGQPFQDILILRLMPELAQSHILNKGTWQNNKRQLSIHVQQQK